MHTISSGLMSKLHWFDFDRTDAYTVYRVTEFAVHASLISLSVVSRVCDFVCF